MSKNHGRGEEDRQFNPLYLKVNQHTLLLAGKMKKWKQAYYRTQQEEMDRSQQRGEKRGREREIWSRVRGKWNLQTSGEGKSITRRVFEEVFSTMDRMAVP